MTNKTYIVSDFSENVQFITEKLNIPESNVISHIRCENEKGFHDWLQGIFSKNEIEKLIIPISIADDSVINTQGLLIGLHIRLNYQLSIEKRCIPIIFLSDFSMENIIKTDNFDKDSNPQNLLFTKGSYFSTFDIEDIEGIIEKSIACSEVEYVSNVLSRLNIKRKATFGGHDISNAWGSYKLGLIIGMGDTIFDQKYASKYLKQLYAKYLICKNEVYDNKKLIDTNPLKCSDKKILFIDDKADEGWGLLMKEIFKRAKNNFVFVDPSKYKANDEHRTFNDFDGFYEECKSHIGKDWDLIIIDLRLDPENEDIDNNKIAPKELSGYKLIDEFLTKNEGYQIIVSTASNKIWNINAALNRGANSYYIKESPDFNNSIRDSQLQFTEFKENVNKCFKRSYLRELYEVIKVTKESETNQSREFLKESETIMIAAWELIKNENIDLAYLILFQIIESYADKSLKFNQDLDSYELFGNTVIEYLSDEGKSKWNLKFNKGFQGRDYFSIAESTQESSFKPSTLFKASCLLYQKYNKTNADLKEFGRLNKIRNNIAHEGEKGFATKNDVIEVLKIIKDIRSN